MPQLPATLDLTDWSQVVTSVFHSLFWNRYQTELVNFGQEPLYVPSSENWPRHRIFFAHGFWSSALHEIAHWCLAGAERRHMLDYGYWYQPDGRDDEMQKIFESVEVKPQALEWLFTSAIGQTFHVSLDNLALNNEGVERFKQAIQAQALRYYREGLPLRAQQFIERLWIICDSKESFDCYWQSVGRESTPLGMVHF